MRISVIIPAAGASTRFGTSDKLAQDLGERPLLLRTVELFTKVNEVSSIIVAGPPDQFDQFQDRYAATLSFHGATVVKGGRIERWETVKNALQALSDDATHVAVHDAARPGASQDLLNRVFEAAASLDAVVPGLPISSTVKRIGDASVDAAGEEDAVVSSILGDVGRKQIMGLPVIETIDRGGLYEIQTPQVFEHSLLRRAYDQDDLSGATDDSCLVERLGETVHVVEGESRNFKVTTPDDLVLMRCVLGVRAPAERPAHKRF